jgi:hypothetical protein
MVVAAEKGKPPIIAVFEFFFFNRRSFIAACRRWYESLANTIFTFFLLFIPSFFPKA